MLAIIEGLTLAELVKEQKSEELFEGSLVLLAFHAVGNGPPFLEAKTSGLSYKPGQISDDYLDFYVLGLAQ